MKIIPITKLRYFYNFFKLFSTKTQIEILNDLNRGNNFNKLVEIFNESKDEFSDYCNYNPFLPTKIKRKQLPVVTHTTKFTTTPEIISFLENNKKPNIIPNDSNLSFRFVNYEISTLRTTSAIFPNGKSGASSGSGGVDFIGYNIKNDIPILGEIKIVSDQNPFYAIIQLLTYLAELSTMNQINRINYNNLFPNKITNKFYLYILLSNLSKDSLKYTLLKKSKLLAKKLKNEISNIEEIIFLELNNPSTGIKKI